MSDKRSATAAFGADLAAELQSVTLEEFRPTEAWYPGWESVHWTAVERRVARAVSPAGGRPDDTMIGLDLVRGPKWLPSRPEPTG